MTASQRITSSWRTTASRCAALDEHLRSTRPRHPYSARCRRSTRTRSRSARLRSSRPRHPRSLAHVRKSKPRRSTHDGFATHDGLVALDGLAMRDARPRARRDHVGCALRPRRSTRTRSRSSRPRHPRSLAHVRKSKPRRSTHVGFATRDGLVTLDGLAVRDVRPCARRDHVSCALRPRRSTRTRSRSR